MTAYFNRGQKNISIYFSRVAKATTGATEMNRHEGTHEDTGDADEYDHQRVIPARRDNKLDPKGRRHEPGRKRDGTVASHAHFGSHPGPEQERDDTVGCNYHKQPKEVVI
jgi:hypothetical protein